MLVITDLFVQILFPVVFNIDKFCRDPFGRVTSDITVKQAVPSPSMHVTFNSILLLEFCGSGVSVKDVMFGGANLTSVEKTLDL